MTAATGDEASEVLGIVQRIAPAVLSAAVKPTGTVGTALRRAVGMMVADRNMVDPQVFSFALNVCLDLARHCGATLVTMDRVRKQALKETPVSGPAMQTVLAVIRLTLAMDARIIDYMTFPSRDVVDQIAVAVNTTFTATEEIAADALDIATYTAILALHGNVVQHLADQGRQLPRVIPYNVQMTMPSLRMAQRAYADPTRHTELIAENRVCHPAFMPRQGIMLAV